MKQRRLSKHSLPLAVTLAFALFGQSFASAKSLCAPLFQSYENSQKTMGDIIQDLAKLKLQIDLAHTQTQNSPQVKALEKEFVRLMTELVQKTSYTKEDIKKAIAAEIAVLQNRQLDQVTKENKSRAKEKETVEKSVRSIALPPEFNDYRMDKDNILYLEKTREILFLQGGIFSYSLETRKVSPLMPFGRSITLSADRNSFYSATDSNKLVRYDLNQRKITSEVELEYISNLWFTNVTHRLTVSPDGKFAVVTLGDKSMIYEVATGKHVTYLEGASNNIENIHFTSKSKFLYNSKKEIIEVTLPKAKTKSIGLLSQYPKKWTLSSDAQYIIASRWDALEILPVNGDASLHQVFKNSDGLLPTFLPFKSKGQNLVAITNQPEMTGIFDLTNLHKNIFDFNGKYISSVEEVVKILITPDSSQLLVFVKDTESLEMRLDIWQL